MLEQMQGYLTGFLGDLLTLGDVVAQRICGGTLVALQTPGPGSIPASRTVENNENQQSHCVYCKISVKLERILHLREKKFWAGKL